jgi:acyl-CoA dehydrogenase
MDYGQLEGFLLAYPAGVSVSVAVLFFVALAYNGAPLWLWSVLGIGTMVGFGAPLPAVITLVAILAVFNIKPIRAMLVSSLIMKVMKKILPPISQTERVALEAGVVWADAELFSGKPNFNRLMKEPYPKLTAEEQAFIDGPTNELCAMVDDWEVWKSRELPPKALQFLKDKGFLGMIIPKEYGGLEMSASAHADVIMKLTTRSVALGVTVMVPNSLGPAELLIHYGTDAQKKRYLPRLAKGLEMPCFGLTEPNAGSDAGSITSEGVVFKGDDGKLYIKLNWQKRWITLAAISTLIGLAFRLRDPQNLLGKGEDVGITCALVPSNLKGVVIGRRHDPLGVPFYNCPTEGHDVVISVEDDVIGAAGGCGLGWTMLMDCLAAGRGISLPSQSAGGTKLAFQVTSAHAVIRKQFGMSIGKFEGVEEPLARIASAAYYLEAMRMYTLSALNQHIKPPVITAMAKYNATEVGRKVINDAMDIVGGAGISMGPRNTMALAHIANPIGITVEGANILTRTLIVFGQGAMRAHPYVFKEVDAADKNDVKAFDAAFFGHIGHIVRNTSRAIVLSFTRGYITTRGYGSRFSIGRHFQRMAWASATFATMSDIAMGLLAGKLKGAQKITGRFADYLSWMYIGTAVLRRWDAEGRRVEDLPYVHYSMNIAFYEMQKAFDGILHNFNVPVIGWIFKGPIRWWSGVNAYSQSAEDAMGQKIVKLMLSDSDQRRRIYSGIYMPANETEQVARLEKAFVTIKRSEAIERKVRDAVKAKKLPKIKGPKLIEEALAKGVITQVERADLLKAEELRNDAIQVDDFSEQEYHSRGTTVNNNVDNPARMYGK